jgi:hypothetical protein
MIAPLIDIVIYSYKQKMLKKIVLNLIEKSSKKNGIHFTLYDQNPLTRIDFFKSIKSCQYNHIFWDNIKGPCHYKAAAVNDNLCDSDFMLLMSDNILLKDNWDEELINALPNKNSIISVKNKIQLKNQGLFYFKKEESVSDIFSSTNFVGRDLIFGHSSTLKRVGYPQYLKYYGEEETLSMMYYSDNVKVYSCPNNFYAKEGKNTIEEIYTTFSKYHNYNEMISLLKNEKNKHIDLNNPLSPSIENFCQIHGIDRNSIYSIPFPDTDVEYDPDESKYRDIESNKFMTKVNYID